MPTTNGEKNMETKRPETVCIVGPDEIRPCGPCRAAHNSQRSHGCNAAYAAELRAGIDDGEQANRADGIASRRFDHQVGE